MDMFINKMCNMNQLLQQMIQFIAFLYALAYFMYDAMEKHALLETRPGTGKKVYVASLCQRPTFHAQPTELHPILSSIHMPSHHA
mmetsp:Transcript_25684/g.75877  ORF Transcript_25684/g.75877 Transcript_25684/m.75877 type:complete len:85 (-) Transcript_25684:2749-3003(-)